MRRIAATSLVLAAVTSTATGLMLSRSGAGTITAAASTTTIAASSSTTSSTTPALPVAQPDAIEHAVADPIIRAVGADPVVDPIGHTVAQAEAIFREVVPAPWRAAVPANLRIVGGYTSMSYTNGVIEVAQFHLTGAREHAVAVIAHEWAHQAAYRYGSRAFLGAGPSAFPYGGPRPEEMWADCVSLALAGIVDPSHGLPACPADALAFASTWIAAGPPVVSLLRPGPR